MTRSDPTKGWPKTTSEVFKAPVVVSVVGATSSDPSVWIRFPLSGATALQVDGYTQLSGGLNTNNVSVYGNILVNGYYDGTTGLSVDITTGKVSGGLSRFKIDGYGNATIQSNSGAAETLRLVTQGATSESLVIQDLRDSSIVLSIDVDGNFSGTSSATSWKTFTPTISGSTWAIGDGTIQGRYTSLGKTISFEVKIVFGSTSVYGTSGPLIKVTPTGVTANSSIGAPFSATYTDSSTGDMYAGRGIIISGFPNEPQLHTQASPMGQVIDTTPFTWATGDSIVLNGTYETA